MSLRKFDREHFQTHFKSSFEKVTREFTNPRCIRVGEYEGEILAIKHNSPANEWKIYKLLAQHPHPNIVTPKGRLVCQGDMDSRYKSDPDYKNRSRSIIMEGVKDGPCAILSGKNIPLKKLLVALKGLAEGLAHLHSLNIVHHDLSCNNILVSQKGEDFFLKICDFELSEIVKPGDSCSEENRTSGTPYYTAPEQHSIEGKITNKIDIYSLGVVMDYILVGVFGIENYWNGDRSQQWLVALIKLCRFENPDKRPSSMDVVSIINHILDEL